MRKALICDEFDQSWTAPAPLRCRRWAGNYLSGVGVGVSQGNLVGAGAEPDSLAMFRLQVFFEVLSSCVRSITTIHAF